MSMRYLRSFTNNAYHVDIASGIRFLAAGDSGSGMNRLFDGITAVRSGGRSIIRSANVVFCFACLSLLFPGSAFSETTVLTYFQADHRYDYRLELLTLAMEKTRSDYGPYRISAYPSDITQKRGLYFLEGGKVVNIAFLPATRDLESRFLPVKIPILRGLLGYRICIVRKPDLEKFAQVDSFESLRTGFTAGFGSQWADMSILRANGLHVIGSVQYENLFQMLAAGRFDYFPRGVNEIWGELDRIKNTLPDLVADPHLALYYPYPVYFFVNRKDTFIADRIEKGLKIALGDGSFKTLFMHHHQGILDKADLKDRKLFILNNPDLGSPADGPDTSWWMTPP